MMVSRLKFYIVLFALPVVLKFTARRHPAFAARLRQRNLVAQIKARDEGIGRWISIRDGEVSSGWGMHAKPDVTLVVQKRHDRRLAAHTADQLAQPDQRAEGLHARDRRAGGPHQLAGTNLDDDADRRLEIRRPPARRHHALLQHGERRPALRLRQGRQDHPDHADRLRRNRSAAVDDSCARNELDAAAQDDARPARSEQPVDHLFARPLALPDEARRLRSEG